MAAVYPDYRQACEHNVLRIKSSGSSCNVLVPSLDSGCRMGWVPPAPTEAHLPSLFGRFLRRLGTAPI